MVFSCGPNTTDGYRRRGIADRTQRTSSARTTQPGVHVSIRAWKLHLKASTWHLGCARARSSRSLSAAGLQALPRPSRNTTFDLASHAKRVRRAHRHPARRTRGRRDERTWPCSPPLKWFAQVWLAGMDAMPDRCRRRGGARPPPVRLGGGGCESGWAFGACRVFTLSLTQKSRGATDFFFSFFEIEKKKLSRSGGTLLSKTLKRSQRLQETVESLK